MKWPHYEAGLLQDLRTHLQRVLSNPSFERCNWDVKDELHLANIILEELTYEQPAERGTE